MRSVRRLLSGLSLLVLGAAPLRPQAVETPAAFDSAGRVRNLTPALVTRFTLGAPVWPVSGDFREARLFASGDQFVLTVERRDGRVERYPMTPDATRALRAAVDGAMTERGALVTESQTDQVSEPASSKFVRNQMILSAILYSPAIATLAADGKTAGAFYLLSTGASYFIASGIASGTTVTRTMNDLATDGAFRGAFFAGGLFSAFGPKEPGENASAIVTLVGSLGGTVLGFQRAKGLTDAEGKAAKSASSYATYATIGLMGIAGVNDTADYRASALATTAAGILGYAFGPRYPRRSAYTVTAGDINTMWIGSTLGLSAAFVPLIGKDSINDRVGWAAFTGGILGGAFLAERFWVRPYDHTQGDVGQMWLGTLGGALMGSAIVLLAEPNANGALGIITAGGVLGAIGSQALTKPARAGSRRADASVGSRDRRASVELNPAGAVMTAKGVRGTHGLLTVRF